MASRRKAREFALQILYFIEMAELQALEAVQAFFQHFNASEESREFCEDVIAGVVKHRQKIDQLISKYSEHWKLNRIDLVDRNILRLAIYELLYRQDIPKKVTLNEAIEVGKKYGSENTSAFLNGILDRVSKEEE